MDGLPQDLRHRGPGGAVPELQLEGGPALLLLSISYDVISYDIISYDITLSDIRSYDYSIVIVAVAVAVAVTTDCKSYSLLVLFKTNSKS